MRRAPYILILAMIFMMSCMAQGEQEFVDSQGNKRIENPYIAIFVNQGPENMGRFGLDVTGGNPLHTGDNNKPLLYGHPKPWTSYTTIQIEGENYVFGGPTTTRAGRNAEYGKTVQSPEVIDGKKIVTTFLMKDAIEVTQTLSFMESITTGFPDTAKIEYSITNTGEEAKDVGIRIMLDTMLGANDGAPFRALDEAITQDKFVVGDRIPEFWQAFDSLEDPMVMAQGNLRGTELTTPDEVYFSNWGSLADGPWDFNFVAGRDFIREGEFELDSAIALYWAPSTLEPGQTETYVTSYGLAGITIQPGLLSLGTSAPAKVAFDGIQDEFEIRAYLETTTDFTARDVIVKLELPPEFVLRGPTEATIEIGDLDPDDSRSISWRVTPRSLEMEPGEMEYRIVAEASNTDSNEVARKVEFTSPPALEIELKGPERLNIEGHALFPDPFTITGIIRNTGGSPAYRTTATLALPPGLSLAYGDRGDLLLGTLDPGEKVEIDWRIICGGGRSGNSPFGLEVKAINASTMSTLQFMNIPGLEASLYMEKEQESVFPGDIFTVHVRMANVSDLKKLELDLRYNPELARAMYASRGGVFVQNNATLPFQHPTIHEQQGIIAGIKGDVRDREVEGGTLVSIHFLALEKGEFTMDFLAAKLFNHDEELIVVKKEYFNLSIE